jgi:ABC-2 type transport system permease protein
MLRDLFLKTLRDQRRSLAWWSAGLLAFGLFMTSLYPTIRDSSAQLDQYVRNLPEAVRALMGGLTDYASPTGYLKAELFSMMVPIVLLVHAIGTGARSIAGEEERRTLDLLLSTPLPRHRVVLEKAAALACTLLVLGAVLWGSVTIGAAVVGMDVGPLRLGQQCLAAVVLALAFGVLALAIGAATGSRTLAAAVAATLAVAAYLLNALAPLVDALRPYRAVSAFHHYAAGDPIVHGLSAAHTGVLLGGAAVLIAAALVGFERRDLAA